MCSLLSGYQPVTHLVLPRADVVVAERVAALLQSPNLSGDARSSNLRVATPAGLAGSHDGNGRRSRTVGVPQRDPPADHGAGDRHLSDEGLGSRQIADVEEAGFTALAPVTATRPRLLTALVALVANPGRSPQRARAIFGSPSTNSDRCDACRRHRPPLNSPCTLRELCYRGAPTTTSTRTEKVPGYPELHELE